MWERLLSDAGQLQAQGGLVLDSILVVSLVGWALLFRLGLAHLVRPEPAPAPDAGRLRHLIYGDGLVRDRGQLRVVALLASAAPLLGLLGTVLGMMDTFAFLGEQDLPRVDALAGGVGQALLTTQAGLMAALTLLIGHAALERVLRRRFARMEASRAAG